MRVTCKHCGQRYDLSNREVLDMAARLTDRRQNRSRRTPAPGPEVNGNVLAPEDVEGRRMREESIARRLKKNL